MCPPATTLRGARGGRVQHPSATSAKGCFLRRISPSLPLLRAAPAEKAEAGGSRPSVFSAGAARSRGRRRGAAETGRGSANTSPGAGRTRAGGAFFGTMQRAGLKPRNVVLGVSAAIFPILGCLRSNLTLGCQNDHSVVNTTTRLSTRPPGCQHDHSVVNTTTRLSTRPPRLSTRPLGCQHGQPVVNTPLAHSPYKYGPKHSTGTQATRPYSSASYIMAKRVAVKCLRHDQNKPEEGRDHEHQQKTSALQTLLPFLFSGVEFVVGAGERAGPRRLGGSGGVYWLSFSSGPKLRGPPTHDTSLSQTRCVSISHLFGASLSFVPSLPLPPPAPTYTAPIQFCECLFRPSLASSYACQTSCALPIPHDDWLIISA